MPPYLLTSILFGSAVLCAVLTLYTWRRRTVAGTRYLMLVLVGSILSMIGYGLELITPDLPGKLLFVQFRYLGTALATPAFVLSALWYAGRERWLAPRYIALIALLPALSEILFLFNDWHHLHYVTVGLAAASGFPQLVKTNGPLYWLYIIHSLAYVILAAGVTLHTLLTASRSQRRQAGLVFAATSIPLFATLIYLAGLRPYGFFNFTPLAFSITGLTLGLAIFRYKLLDLRPIAYRAALDRSLMGVIVLDRTGRIADLNRAAQTLLNVQLREALDQPVSQVSREWPALTERLAHGPAINEDVVWERAGLKRVYAIETASLQADGQVLLLHDVTAQRAAEQRTLAQQRLSATLEERERLARELHDGIAQVVGYVSLETGKALEDLAQHRVDAAQTTLTHLQQVAQDAHADLRDFILGVRTGEATVKGFFPTLEKYLEQLRVNYHLSVTLSRPTDWPDDLIGPGVEAQLLRVIQEALTNVRKHAQASSSSVTFTLSATTVQVIIADNGCGFTPTPPDADATAHFGLPMMRERLAEIGGTVEVRSAIGLGTQVVVQAPRRVAQGEHLVGLRVLIADDQPLFRDGLRNLLTARGVRCVGLAENGRQACELARQVQPDLVLLDVNMPDMDGLAALKEIKAEQPHLKVVMLTVADTSTLLREALNAGANGFLLKNLTPTEFFSLLERLARGEAVIAPDLAARVLQETVVSDELSARQQRILTLIAQGKTNKEIAAEFVLTEAAIKYHVGQILERLGAATRDEAVTVARQRGWLD